MTVDGQNQSKSGQMLVHEGGTNCLMVYSVGQSSKLVKELQGEDEPFKCKFLSLKILLTIADFLEQLEITIGSCGSLKKAVFLWLNQKPIII